ncbi:uncharacterized protein METZ01_LOCUS13583 [marine metagenome]|uniref:Uncharacterized protein n=1 Tax=marine metagenome TaxID=408172 RepID=A0A381P342_9ZZZZ
MVKNADFVFIFNNLQNQWFDIF